MPEDLDQELIGTVGRVSVPITKHRMGEVIVAVRGGTEAYGACADEAIPKNSRAPRCFVWVAPVTSDTL